MNLEATLTRLADDFGLPAQELLTYSVLDNLPSYYEDNYYYGTAYTCEAKLLYALLRVIKPAKILELGTCHGGGTSHLALACKHNRRGHIWTVDNNPEAGQHIQEGLGRFVTQIYANIDTELPRIAENGVYDFIYEDASHSENQVHTIVNYLPHLLNPGGWVVHHDAADPGIGMAVQRGIEKGGIPVSLVRLYTVDPSPYGFAIYQWSKNVA